MSHDLGDYIEVKDRIALFHAEYEEGAIQGDWDIVEVGGETFVVYKARAYRSPEDKVPTVGTAWEPFPGKTPFTRNSELMNAETSAVGRAIANLGIGIANSMASKNEILNRKDEPKPITKERALALNNLRKEKGIDHKGLVKVFEESGLTPPASDSNDARATAFFALTDDEANVLEQAIRLVQARAAA